MSSIAARNSEAAAKLAIKKKEQLERANKLRNERNKLKNDMDVGIDSYNNANNSNSLVSNQHQYQHQGQGHQQQSYDSSKALIQTYNDSYGNPVAERIIIKSSNTNTNSNNELSFDAMARNSNTNNSNNNNSTHSNTNRDRQQMTLSNNNTTNSTSSRQNISNSSSGSSSGNSGRNQMSTNQNQMRRPLATSYEMETDPYADQSILIPNNHNTNTNTNHSSIRTHSKNNTGRRVDDDYNNTDAKEYKDEVDLNNTNSINNNINIVEFLNGNVSCSIPNTLNCSNR